MNTRSRTKKDEVQSPKKQVKKKTPIDDESFENKKIKKVKKTTPPKTPEAKNPRGKQNASSSKKESQSRSTSEKKAKNLSDDNFHVVDFSEEADFNSMMDERNRKGKRNGKEKGKEKEKEKQPKNRPNRRVVDPELGVEYDPETFSVKEEGLAIPEWAKEPNIRDKNGNRPEDENYDPTTLYVPPKGISKSAVLLYKYWEVKSQHYDKLVFMKLRGAYLTFYKDAYICHTELGIGITQLPTYALAWIVAHKMSQYFQQLVEKNYRIVIIEPTQTYDNKDDARLELYQILSRGTFIESNNNRFTSRYCLLLAEKDLSCGFTYLDTTTHEFYMGEFKDSPNRTHLKSLLLRLSPVEIVYRDKTLSKETILMLKGLHWRPLITPLQTTQPIGLEFVVHKINSYVKDEANPQVNPNWKILINLIEIAEDFLRSTKRHPNDLKKDEACSYYWTLQGIFFALEYLEYLHLAKLLFTKCRFFLHELSQNTKKNLVLDGQTVSNLELFDVDYLTNQTGVTSLFKYIDSTKSPFGRRMLRRWLLEPLRDIDRINERLDAVEELKANTELIELIQGKIRYVPDLEKLIHCIYNTDNKKILHWTDFESFVRPIIYLFVEALKRLREVDNIMKIFSEHGAKVQSKRLVQLLNYTTTRDGLFPEVDKVLSELEASIIMWDELPVPAPGKDDAFDKLMKEATDVKHEFRLILEYTKKMLKCDSICFAHVRYRYQLEIPEQYVAGNKKPKEFTETSRKKGYVRFHTPKLLELIERLEDIEKRMHKVIQPYTVKCLKEFYTHNLIWNQAILCLGELDCLASLAQLAKTMPLACRPSFQTENEKIFNLQGVVHPCLMAKAPTEFIKNDIMFDETQSIFLITGPNMGGKSTLMRSVCLATIMAQMGSYVAAESFTLSPKDRVFTRIGASDNLFEGKSTFFVELEETLNIVNNATERSIVIMDELGRGTSTYDGMAIAYAVLKFLITEIGCLTFFATHFHLLLEEFRLYKRVVMYYMDFLFVEGEHLTFLYKFKKGSIGQSFGINVAKIAGLPTEVIQKGKEIAMFFNREQVNLQRMKTLSEKFVSSIEILSDLRHDEDIESIINELDLIGCFSDEK